MDEKCISKVETFVFELILVNPDGLDVFFHNFFVQNILSYLVHNFSELAFHFLSEFAFEIMNNVE